MLILYSVVAIIVGVLMYALCANPKLQEIGRLTFFAGMLAFLLQVGGHIFSALHG